MHGVAVPELLWCGRDLARFPVHDLPARVAVRRAWGGARSKPICWWMGVTFWMIAPALRKSSIPASGANTADGPRTHSWWRNFLRMRQGSPEPANSIFIVFAGPSVWWSMSSTPATPATEPPMTPLGSPSLEWFMRLARGASPFRDRLGWMRCSRWRGVSGPLTAPLCALISTSAARASTLVNFPVRHSMGPTSSPGRITCSASCGRSIVRSASEPLANRAEESRGLALAMPKGIKEF